MWYYILMFVVIGLLIYLPISSLKKYDIKSDKKHYDELWDIEIDKEYNKWFEENNLKISDCKVIIPNCYNLDFIFNYADALVWRQDNHLLMCPSLDSLKTDIAKALPNERIAQIVDNHLFEFFYEEIDINLVKCYKADGELLSHTSISGGGVTGGGTSITGTIIGGVLAGDVGAIIGSRKKIEVEPVSVHTYYEDKRVVNVFLERDGVIKIQQYPYKLYDAFQKLMPEKSYDYIALHQTTQPKEKSSADRLQELQALKDSGLITEDEYLNKRIAIVSEI